MDPKAIALGHFEKVVLAGFVGWLAVAASGLIMPSGADVAEIQVKLRDIKSHMDTAPVPKEDPPRWQEEISRRLGSPEPTKAYPSWLAHRRPSLGMRPKEVDPAPEPAHMPPRDFQGRVDRGKVELSWTIATEDNKLIRIDELEVLRRDVPKEGEAQASWQSLWKAKRTAEQDDVQETRFVDEKVAPRSRYEYKLVQVAVLETGRADKAVEKWNLKLEDGHEKWPPVREVTWTMETETPRDTYITLERGGVLEPPPEQRLQGEPPTADLKVWKWDPKSGSFLAKVYYRVKEGQKGIGKVEPHPAARGEKFDFSTGAELVEAFVDPEREVTLAGVKMKRKVGVIKIKWPGVGAPEPIDELTEFPDLKKK